MRCFTKIRLVTQIVWAGQVLVTSGVAVAAPARIAAQIPAGDLATALLAFAHQSGIEILYDPHVVAGKRSTAVDMRADPETILKNLLKSSGITYRTNSRGAYVLFVAVPALRPAAPVAVPDTEAVAEILVVGRHTLNADIRRSEDDIQPYHVADGDSIRRAQSETPEDFLRTQLPANAEAMALSQAPDRNNGDPRSEINLRGLGPNQTLVLIDGRRMPSFPTVDDFEQPNLNGIPLDSIARIESLASTAGGIFGPDATGGVVNIVIDRNYHSAGLSVTQGISEQGDAPTWRLDAHAGFSSAGGHTRIMFAYSHAVSAGLNFGDRNFVANARALRIANAPDMFYAPPSPSLNITSAGEGPLTFTSAYGGGQLGSDHTFLPFTALSPAATLAALTANAGHYNLALSPDASGIDQSLLSRTASDGGIVSVRQDITPSLEAFIDVLVVSDRGSATAPRYASDGTYVSAGSPDNPFQQDLLVSFPIANASGTFSTQNDTARYTAGLIAQFPRHWTADIDATIGRSSLRQAGFDTFSVFIDPFQGAAALAQQLPNFFHFPDIVTRASDHMTDYNMRIAGPIVTLPGGPLVITVTGESRNETVPQQYSGPQDPADAPYLVEITPQHNENVLSFYAETRAPIVPSSSPIAPLRGLELQLSVRHDRTRISIPGYTDPNGNAIDQIQDRYNTFAVTVGGRVRPINGIMLRASYATGYLPPNLDQISENQYTYGDPVEGILVNDPKRGNQLIGAGDQPIVLDYGGSATIKPELARSFSAGFVATPKGVPGLRISIDYSRITKSHEITEFASLDAQFFIDHEADFPSRVIRAPLTAADQAMGYTGGIVTEIDTSALNVGRTRVEAVDFSGEYRRATRFGNLRIHGYATWEPTFRRSGNPFAPSYSLVNYSDGPLEWKGNAGVDWNRKAWSAGLDVQYYGHQRITAATPSPDLAADNAEGVREQGALWLPHQVYVDAQVGFSVPWGGGKTLFLRLGVKNLLNAQPPLSVVQLGGQFLNGGRYDGIGYSSFGDPRGRRYQFTTSLAL